MIITLVVGIVIGWFACANKAELVSFWQGLKK